MSSPSARHNNAPVAQEGDSELVLASHKLDEGRFRTRLSVPDMHCGGCMSKVEKALGALPEVGVARANLTNKRATVEWTGETAPDLLGALSRVGFSASYVDEPSKEDDPQFHRLAKALAVAGFATANIMLLSIAVWAGADPSTRDLFHWISAAIALPTLLYSGRIFFQSAFSALKHGRTNMDVPISVGVTLAFGYSVLETARGGPDAYFDAAVALLFFLLIGRLLDHSMRERARSTVKGLARLAPRSATVVGANGDLHNWAVSDLAPGDVIVVAAGERLPVDGRIEAGSSLLDCAMVTGESEPVAVDPDCEAVAGSLNLKNPLRIEVTTQANESFLAEMIRLMEVAEGGRRRYRLLIDRVSALYSPVVHLAAAASGLGWLALGADVHMAVSTAIAVLIITCPCALGLAIPIVHVVAASRFIELGLLVKDGSAVERLAEVDLVAFDKTGTLTRQAPTLTNGAELDRSCLAAARALAQHSRHPLAQAVTAATANVDDVPDVTNVEEIAGQGVAARVAPDIYSFGRRSWTVRSGEATQPAGGPEVVLARNGIEVAAFKFDEELCEGAHAMMRQLDEMRLDVAVISGDRRAAVSSIADRLGVQVWHSELLPSAKVEFITKLTGEGRRVLMVGDGMNDAPSLSAAHVSIAPSSAADIGRQAADMVLVRDGLSTIPRAVEVATRARTLVRENLAFSIAYNAVAIPFAVLGYITPLVAALAMSLSSMVVVANAMRLPRQRRIADELASASPTDMELA